MSRKTILVVDDDVDARLGLSALLRSSDYETVFAEDGVSAVRCAVKERPDVILLDLGLPAGDGLVILERLKQNPSLAHIPVIVVTARDAAEAEKRVLDAGAFAFLQKPYESGALLAAVFRALH